MALAGRLVRTLISGERARNLLGGVGGVSRWRIAAAGAVVALLGLGAAGVAAPASASPRHHLQASGFNSKGDILIADQFSNRVIEINRHHQVVWHFGDGSSVPGPHSIVGTNDAERVGSFRYERASLIVTSNKQFGKAHMFAPTCARQRRSLTGSAARLR